MYKDQYAVTVLELKDIESLNIKNTSINSNMLIGAVEFNSGEIINVRGNPEIHVCIKRKIKL